MSFWLKSNLVVLENKYEKLTDAAPSHKLTWPNEINYKNYVFWEENGATRAKANF